MSKTAFITGAGGYIGRETALKLAKNGVNIAVCDINAETVEKTVSEIKKNRRLRKRLYCRRNKSA